MTSLTSKSPVGARGMDHALYREHALADQDMLVEIATCAREVSSARIAATFLGHVHSATTMAGVFLGQLCANACRTGPEKAVTSVQRTSTVKTAILFATT